MNMFLQLAKIIVEYFLFMKKYRANFLIRNSLYLAIVNLIPDFVKYININLVYNDS